MRYVRVQGYQVNNTSIIRDSPAGLSLSAVPVIQTAWMQHRCERKLYFPTQESSEDEVTASVFMCYSGGWALSVLLSPPTHGAFIPRCVCLSVPLLQTEITAAPPSSNTRLPCPMLGLQAVCCRWSVVFIFRLTVTSEDRTSFCRTTKEKGAPQR